MNGAGLDLLCALPSVACLPVLWILFDNPQVLGVREARALVAKRTARVVFWYAAAAAIASGRFSGIGPFPAGHGWLFAVLPFATVASSVAFAIRLARTHPGILETASDELVRRWKRRFFTGSDLAIFFVFAALCAAARML